MDALGPFSFKDTNTTNIGFEYLELDMGVDTDDVSVRENSENGISYKLRVSAISVFPLAGNGTEALAEHCFSELLQREASLNHKRGHRNFAARIHLAVFLLSTASQSLSSSTTIRIRQGACWNI